MLWLRKKKKGNPASGAPNGLSDIGPDEEMPDMELAELEAMLHSRAWRWMEWQAKGRLRKTLYALEKNTGVLTNEDGSPQFGSVAEQNQFWKGECLSLRWFLEAPHGVVNLERQREEEASEVA